MNQVTFRGRRRFLGPSWLVGTGTGDESDLVEYVVDLLKDAFAERARQGQLARLPQQDATGQATAPDDALAAMGRDRRIVRGFNESSVSYASRLLRWLDDWQTAGNPFALMRQVQAYMGLSPAGAYASLRTVDVRGNWFSIASDGTPSVSLNQANWDWDGAVDALTRWARFWLIIYPNGVWLPGPRWGDAGAVWGAPGATWGSTATVDQVGSVRGIVSDWKPAGTTCANIILAFDPTSFNPATARDGSGLPDGTWGKWGQTIAGVYGPTRLATARYWDGV